MAKPGYYAFKVTAERQAALGTISAHIRARNHGQAIDYALARTVELLQQEENMDGINERVLGLATVIHAEVCGCDNPRCTTRQEVYEWLEEGDGGEGRTLADLVAEWRDYEGAEQQEGDVVPTVTAAQMIRHYHGPQYLVEPVGEASGADDLESINRIGFEVLTTEVQGWGDHNAIIFVHSFDEVLFYLARLA